MKRRREEHKSLVVWEKVKKEVFTHMNKKASRYRLKHEKTGWVTPNPGVEAIPWGGLSIED